jgi:hypothetical protein
MTMNAHEPERLLRYHRPVLEDGQIGYEFLYASSQPVGYQVHPAIDRCAFLLRPDGVRIHWCTDGIDDQTSLSSTNEFDEPENRRGDARLPLQRITQSCGRGARISIKESLLPRASTVHNNK